nr:tigger transposable element-derived protein 6-like [Nicotiana tomentosiformis]
MAPNKTLAQVPESGWTKKLKPLVIGAVAKPHCYKNVDMASLPHINYFYNKKAWMNRKILKQYMLNLNAKFEDENRKILLLMDNATLRDIEEYESQLTHIKVHHLPPNTTSHLQPADASIIANFKVKYKSRFIKHLIDKYERYGSHPLSSDNKCNMRQAINPLAGILPTDDNSNIDSENIELVEDVGNVSSLISQISSNNINDTMDATTYVTFDATLLIIETLTDEEDTIEADESADEEPQPTATWTEIEDLIVKLLDFLQGKAIGYPFAESLDANLR